MKKFIKMAGYKIIYKKINCIFGFCVVSYKIQDCLFNFSEKCNWNFDWETIEPVYCFG